MSSFSPPPPTRFCAASAGWVVQVSDINQAIVDARDVNDLGGAAVLRITLKDSERM